MPISNSKRRKTSFPLTFHPSRQWCKKIRGKLYYFGTDKKVAHQRYLAQAAHLHAGHTPSRSVNTDDMAVKDLANHYLTHQHERLETGEITAIHFKDCQTIMKAFVRAIGKATSMEELTPQRLYSYRSTLLKKFAPSTVNRHIAIVKAAFNYAVDFEFITRSPNLRKSLPKVAKKKMRRFKTATEQASGKRVFEPETVQEIIKESSGQLKGMILLGINGGFGNTDCSELRRDAIDLGRGVIEWHRIKTGVQRTVPLWPESIEVLRDILAVRNQKTKAEDADRVFVTRFGHPWVRAVVSEIEGRISVTKNDEISKRFNKLLTSLGIKRRGLAFYSLRHTFRTWADEVHDQHAIHRIMGHALPGMSGIYVEKISIERLRIVVEHVREKVFG